MTQCNEKMDLPPTGFRHWITLPILAFGLALVVLDGTIVGVALPKIILDLHLDLAMSQWINAIYAVVFAALLIGFGNLGDQIGRKRIFLTGVVVFMLSSLTAGWADEAVLLVASRLFQGIGGAMVLPASLSIVNALFQGRDRAIAFGVWGSVMAGTAAIGPLVGGWLTTYYSWRWVFFVNIPIAIAVLVTGLIFLPQTFGKKQPGFDWPGLALSIIGLGSLVFAIIEGSTLGWWRPQSDLTIGSLVWPKSAAISIIPVCFAVGILVMVGFVILERRRLLAKKPVLMDFTLFQISTFSVGNLTALTVAVAEFTLVFVFPLYLVIVLKLSILKSGYVLAGMAAGAFLSGAMARHLSARFGAPKVVVIGLGLEFFGLLFTVFQMTATTNPFGVVIPLVVYGLGLGLASAQLTSTVLNDVPVEISGQGSAIQSTLRQIGSALGTALSGSILALSTHFFVTKKLNELAFVPAKLNSQLADATTDSVGSNLLAASQRPVANAAQAEMAQKIMAAMTEGFRLGTVHAMTTALVFLAIGVICAVLLVQQSQKRIVSSPGGSQK